MTSKIVSIILAAGSSSRFGENKFLSQIGDKHLIERTLESFLNHQDTRNDVIVVTGHYTDQLKSILKNQNITQIHNPSFNLGMSSSIQQGLDYFKDRIQKYSGLIIHPGDIPLIGIEDIERMLLCHRSFPNKIIIPKFNRKRGHPILIPKIFYQALLIINDETQGLRGLLQNNEIHIKYVNVNNQGILEDIDTQKDLEELEHLF